MKRIVSSSCAAVVLSATVAMAQANSQVPTQSPVQTNQQGTRTQAPAITGASAAQQITIVGCVQREGDSPSAGITARRGAGDTSSTGSEFILANAMPASGAGNIAGSVSGSTSSGRTTTGTSGSGSAGVSGNVGVGGNTGVSGNARASSSVSSTGTSYTLSGDKERELAQYVGQRVEIVATMMPASGSTGAGASAGGSIGVTGSTRTPEATTTRTPGATQSDSTPDAAGVADQTARNQAAGARQEPATTTTAHPSAMQRVEIVSFRPLGTNCQ